RLPDAAEGRLLVPRLDPGRATRARPGAVQRPGPPCRTVRHPGVAELLLQGPDGRARPVSGARLVHPGDEVEEHPALDDGRGADHPPRARVLRRRLTPSRPIRPEM